MNKPASTIIILISFTFSALAQNAKEIVRKAEDKFNGEKSGYSEMVMTIVRPAYTREVEFKNWVQESEKSLTLITAPAKEKGQTFLKSADNMWNWNPTIQRLIKLPPSMMSQGWMGSDYTNDDILNESSLVSDFTHKITGNETIEGQECHIIELIPLENADVVWGKIILWISKNEFLNFRAEYYDETQYLVKTHISRKVKSFDDRRLPSIIEIIPEEEEGHKTLIEIKEMKFNIELEANFFSQQNMKKIR